MDLIFDIEWFITAYINFSHHVNIIESILNLSKVERFIEAYFKNVIFDMLVLSRTQMSQRHWIKCVTL